MVVKWNNDEPLLLPTTINPLDISINLQYLTKFMGIDLHLYQQLSELGNIMINRRAEAKNPFLNIGIKTDVFPESIPKTAVSYAVVQMMSTWLGKSKTFK